MKTKLTTLLAIALFVAAVAVSCSRPSTTPAPTGPVSAVRQASLPTNIFGPPVIANTQITPANLTTTSPLIPSDLYRTNNTVDHVQAAKFAWLEFIALVSPVQFSSQPQPSPSPVRGVPGNSFSSVKGGSNSTYPLVWETFQHRSELFPSNGSGGVTRPQPWNNSPKYVYSAPAPTYPAGVEALFNNLDEGSQIFQNNLFYPNPANPTQPPYEVLFEAKANQWESQYVNDSYPLPPAANLPPGSIEIKAAWRPVASIDPSQLYRYHIANVITYGGTMEQPVAQSGQYALIALHIIHKTTNYPSFIFATFEQVDAYMNQATNPATPTGVFFQTIYPGLDQPPPATPTPLPTPPGYQYGAYYFAVDPSGYSAPGTQPSPLPNPSTFTVTNNPTRVFDVNKPLAWPNGVEYKSPNGTGFYPEPGKVTSSPPLAAPIQTKVTLPPTGNNDVANINQEVRDLINSLNLGKEFVWQYYQLTGVQAIPTSDETTKDYYLANIVVESSQAGIQLFRGGLSPNPSFEPEPNIRNKINVNDAGSGLSYSMGGCMGCHGAAQKQGGDFSFLLSTGQAGFNVDLVYDTPQNALKNATLRRTLIQRNPNFKY